VSPMGNITVAPVTPERWDELATFFGPSGAYSGCWCTYFRQTSAEFNSGCRDQARGNRSLLRRITVAGQVPGLLAYDGEEPVGWVSVAPRPEFGRVLRSPRLRPGPDEDPDDVSVWSVVCFWVPRTQRGRGLSGRLLDAAVGHARAGEARLIEGYPIDGSAREEAAAIFTGTVKMFHRAGFLAAPDRPPAGRRLVVRRKP
jgi:GNAT superfamily N-acetyltransferase